MKVIANNIEINIGLTPIKAKLAKTSISNTAGITNSNNTIETSKSLKILDIYFTILLRNYSRYYSNNLLDKTSRKFQIIYYLINAIIVVIKIRRMGIHVTHYLYRVEFLLFIRAKPFAHKNTPRRLKIFTILLRN